MQTFAQRLQTAWSARDSLLCVGIDPDLSRLPQGLPKTPAGIEEFCRALVDATAPYACAFKVQFAHFAASAAEGELARVLQYIRDQHPTHLTILDAKRGDIPSTATMYAREAFVRYQADAVTVNPYLGGDAIAPFVEDPQFGAFVLCRTSNPGSAQIQQFPSPEHGLARAVAGFAADWSSHANLGLVVGATWPEELGELRRLAPRLPFLVPGIGAQGGDLARVLKAGLDADQRGLLINASRSIAYASEGRDFADAAANAARELHEAIGLATDRSD